jgi:hypothetical protein
MATPEEIKAAQDAKAAEAKAAQDAKDAEAKAKEEAELAELHEWVARAMINAYPHGVPPDKVDPTPAMDKAREFVAAFNAMGSHKAKPAAGALAPGPFGWLRSKDELPLAPITGLSATVGDNNTVVLKWDAPAPGSGTEVVVFDGDTILGTVPIAALTYTTGMMAPGPHVFTVAVGDGQRTSARSNAVSVSITEPVVP